MNIESLLGEEAVASPSIGNTLWRVSTMFTRSAITPPGVNGFGWNLGHSEYAVRSWPWQILGAIRAEARAGERAEVFFCQENNALLYRFPVSQISRNLHTRRGSMSPWILSENICENSPVRGLFPKRQLLRENLHATFDFRPRFHHFSEMITNRGMLRQVGMPTECWLSTCTVGIINSKWFPWPAGYVQERTFLDIAGCSV